MIDGDCFGIYIGDHDIHMKPDGQFHSETFPALAVFNFLEWRSSYKDYLTKKDYVDFNGKSRFSGHSFPLKPKFTIVIISSAIS